MNFATLCLILGTSAMGLLVNASPVLGPDGSRIDAVDRGLTCDYIARPLVVGKSKVSNTCGDGAICSARAKCSEGGYSYETTVFCGVTRPIHGGKLGCPTATQCANDQSLKLYEKIPSLNF